MRRESTTTSDRHTAIIFAKFIKGRPLSIATSATFGRRNCLFPFSCRLHAKEMLRDRAQGLQWRACVSAAGQNRRKRCRGCMGEHSGHKKSGLFGLSAYDRNIISKKRAAFTGTLRSFATEFDATVSPVAIHKPRPQPRPPTSPRHQLQRLRKPSFYVSLC